MNWNGSADYGTDAYSRATRSQGTSIYSEESSYITGESCDSCVSASSGISRSYSDESSSAESDSRSTSESESGNESGSYSRSSDGYSESSDDESDSNVHASRGKVQPTDITIVLSIDDLAANVTADWDEEVDKSLDNNDQSSASFSDVSCSDKTCTSHEDDVGEDEGGLEAVGDGNNHKNGSFVAVKLESTDEADDLPTASRMLADMRLAQFTTARTESNDCVSVFVAEEVKSFDAPAAYSVLSEDEIARVDTMLEKVMGARSESIDRHSFAHSEKVKSFDAPAVNCVLSDYEITMVDTMAEEFIGAPTESKDRNSVDLVEDVKKSKDGLSDDLHHKAIKKEISALESTKNAVREANARAEESDILTEAVEMSFQYLPSLLSISSVNGTASTNVAHLVVIEHAATDMVTTNISYREESPEENGSVESFVPQVEVYQDMSCAKNMAYFQEKPTESPEDDSVESFGSQLEVFQDKGGAKNIANAQDYSTEVEAATATTDARDAEASTNVHWSSSENNNSNNERDTQGLDKWATLTTAQKYGRLSRKMVFDDEYQCGIYTGPDH